LIRAKMCELLAIETNQDKEHFFLVGLLSGLDVMLDQPLDKVLQQLPLSPTIAGAILQKSGLAGQALQYAIDYERWEIDKPTFQGIDLQRISSIYLESIEWWTNCIYPLFK